MKKQAAISNEDTEKCLRTILLSEGYELSPLLARGETGVDILAKKEDEEHLHIEVIGYKASGPARAKDFFESFFRAVSRIKDGAHRCIIAMPMLAEQGLPTRAHHYGEAWLRIGQVFPELEIWLVNTEVQSYKRSKWNDWATYGERGEGR
jgi:hypothetical protein